MNPILSTQAALVAAITAQEFAWPLAIRPGAASVFDELDPQASAQSLPLPAIVCDANDAQQIHPNVPTYEVQCTVQVRSSADDHSIDQHQAWAWEVAAFLMLPTFAGWVGAYPSVHCEFRGIVSQSYERIGRLWVSTMNFPAFINPKDNI